MISLEKPPLQKLPKNVVDLGKFQSPINRPIWSHWECLKLVKYLAEIIFHKNSLVCYFSVMLLRSFFVFMPSLLSL